MIASKIQKFNENEDTWSVLKSIGFDLSCILTKKKLKTSIKIWTLFASIYISHTRLSWDQDILDFGSIK